MAQPENLMNFDQEPALGRTIYIVNEPNINPGSPDSKELFMVRIPEGLDFGQERAAYEACGGQVRSFGTTVDISTVSYQKWLELKGAQSHYDPTLLKYPL